MSGITGIYHTNGRPADPTLLQRMTEAIAHRGPDGEGHWMSGPVGLGHRLLHTTAESLNEKQPATDESGACWLVWDGRLDNRDELIAALNMARQSPVTPSDPELALEAYRQWGLESVKRLLGDFAFAVWDGRTRTLVCARDPIGVKPLYYHWDGRRLLLASEVTALFADPAIPRRPNEAMIADYLLMGFRDPEATFFEGIEQLRPAHLLCVTDSGLHVRRYWDVDPARQVRYIRDEEYLEAFRELFREAVRCRLRSSGPAGVLLSGGIDSTSVTAMAEMLRGRDARTPELAAFTLLAEGFLQEEWDAIQRVVERYGTEVRALRPETLNGPLTLFELFLDCGETPHYDAFLTVPLLLAPAAERGCRVLLTGGGADELSQSAEHGLLADLLRSLRIRQLVRHARASAVAYGNDQWQDTLVTLLWELLHPAARRWIKTVLNRNVPRWLEAEFARRVNVGSRSVRADDRKFPTMCQDASYRALAQPSMPLALNQIDGMAARFFLECRHPYLDRRVIEFFLAVPSDVKLRKGHRKQFVQRALAEITPGPVRRSEGNAYFVAPMDRRARVELEARRFERDLFGREARVFRYVRRSEAERLMGRYRGEQDGYRNLLWNFVKLELWLCQWFPEWHAGRRGAS